MASESRRRARPFLLAGICRKYEYAINPRQVLEDHEKKVTARTLARRSGGRILASYVHPYAWPRLPTERARRWMGERLRGFVGDAHSYERVHLLRFSRKIISGNMPYHSRAVQGKCGSSINIKSLLLESFVRYIIWKLATDAHDVFWPAYSFHRDL